MARSRRSAAGSPIRRCWATPVPAVADGFAEGLLAAGVPLWRAHLAVSTLDPQVEGIGLTWTRAGGREREEYGHGSFEKISIGQPHL